MRVAIVKGSDPSRGAEERLREVAAYLPANYTARWYHGAIEISGEDVAGWTLGYVCDRLASGLIFAQEVSRYS